MSPSMKEEFVQASCSHESLLRKVDFHLARKPNSYFPTSSCDFKPDTLTPSIYSSASTSDPHCQSVSDFSLSSKKSDFVDHDFGSELSLRITFRRIGAGLENLGNTCFLNSVVQCLTYTEPLAAYLQSGKHQTSCHIAGFCALCAFQKHVSRALQSSGRILVPKDLVSNLQRISRSFRKSRQEDAHEYMIQLLECMHKCCLPSGMPTESPSAYEKSLVHKIFGGRLRSQVKCTQCSYCSNKYDPFLDLSLEIIKADSLYKALVHFTAAEQLDGGQKQYNCERCRQKVRALKQLTVHKAPYVLTVHLKRFGSLINDQKIGKKVHFGATLDLKPFMSGSYEGDLKYTLYGVLVHAGWSTRSGHYYCFVRTSTGTWYSLDDDRVYQVSEKTVLDQKAYMLFYVRNRKNAIPKKPVDVIQRGNMYEPTVQNVSLPIHVNHSGRNQHKTVDMDLRKSAQNGSVPDQLNGRNTYDLPVQRNGSSVLSLNDICQHEEFAQKCHGMISSKCSFIKEKRVVLKSDAQTVTHTMKCTDERPSGTRCMPDASAGVSEDKFSKRDTLASDAKLCGFDCMAGITDEATQNSQVLKVDHVDAAKVHNSLLTGQNETVSKNIDLLESSCKKLHGAPSVDHINLRTGKNKQLKTSKQPTQNNIQRAIIAPKAASGNLSHAKLKKFFMCKTASMHLGKNIFYVTSLSLHKRNKLKRKKRRALKIHPNSVTEEDRVAADVGPSTSGRMASPYGSTKHSHTRGQKSGLRKREAAFAPKDLMNGTTGVREDLMNGTAGPRKKNFKRKLCDRQRQKNLRPLLFGGPDVSKACVNDEVHSSSVSTVTAGLDKTMIGHWQGVELPRKNPGSNGSEDFHIGHVLDEWDEEYDRGRRKKVKKQSRIGFDGSNPFQDVAIKKAKLKR